MRTKILWLLANGEIREIDKDKANQLYNDEVKNKKRHHRVMLYDNGDIFTSQNFLTFKQLEHIFNLRMELKRGG